MNLSVVAFVLLSMELFIIGRVNFMGKRFKLELKEKSYYYNVLPRYGNQILKIFSKYWDILYNYGDLLKNIFLGKVHGNIVNLGWLHYVYANPIDLLMHGFHAL